MGSRLGLTARAAVASAIVACATATPVVAIAGQQAPPQAVQGEPPLGAFASQKLAVMPVQFLRADSLAPVKAAAWAAVRKELDYSVGSAIAARGIGRKWPYAADIVRMAKRNSDYVTDPYSLGAAGLRDARQKVGDPAPMVVINNLRSLIALGDSRFALIPVDLRFSRQGGVVRPVLHLVVVDGRVGQIVWFADVPGDAGPTFASAEIGALAQRIADLVAAR